MAGIAVNVLLVEDDVVDVWAIQRAFTALEIPHPLFVAHDGVEALELLRGTEVQGPLPRPNIILLDLNMPRMNGIEFLKEIRQDTSLRDSVVFILTTSKADQDKFEAYQLNVAGYIVKSEATASLTNAVAMLEHYWRVVELP
jgi:CheY-like chemotaxis protein